MTDHHRQELIDALRAIGRDADHHAALTRLVEALAEAGWPGDEPALEDAAEAALWRIARATAA